MAIVGDAYIVVKAITSGFENDVRKAASGIDLNKDGKSVGESFSRGFGGGVSGGMGRALSDFDRRALATRKQFQSLVRTGFTLGPIISTLVSSIGSLVGGIVSLGSALLAAAPSGVVFATALTSIGIAAIGLTSALKGVGAAISAGSKARKGSTKDVQAEEDALKRLLKATERVAEAQRDFTRAVEDAQEEIQQLGFDAEDAALGEKKAAIELEKARETLQRVQDLPPNSRARREANLAFQEAELNLRRAKDRNADLRKEQERLSDAAAAAGTEVYEQTDTYLNAKKSQIDALADQKDAEDALTKARKGTGDTAYTDALSDLSKEAQDFVKYMVGTFMPSLKELRDALGKELFPQLEAGLEKLRTKLFPGLKPVLTELGDSIGKSFGTIIDAITDIENIGDLEQVIRNAGTNIESYARTVSNLYDGFLSTLVSAQPLANKFNKFLEKKTAGWATYLDTKQATGELEKMFNKAGDIAARIGAVLGNAVSGIVNIVKANFTPGGGGYILLDYFKDVTAEFEKFSGSVAGQDALSEYFKGTAENSKAILSSLGAFIKEILKAGADPNIKKFWDTLAEAAPSLGNLIRELNAGAPALASFVVSLIRFAELTTSSGGITAFFNTLNTLLSTLNNFLAIPAVRAAFDFLAKIFGTVSAIGLAFGAAAFGFRVVAGNILFVVRAVGLLAGKQALATLSTSTFTTKLATMGATAVRATATGLLALAKAIGGAFVTALKFGLALAANPVGAILLAVGLLIAGFALLYSKSETFRNGVDKLFNGLKDIFGNVLTWIKENWVQVIGALTGPIGRAVISIAQNWDKIVETIKSFVTRAKNALGGIWNGLTDGLKTAWDNAKQWWNVNVAAKKLKIGGATILGKTLPSFTLGFPALAEGGIIAPSAGGTLARIGEAGRAERVEPLDPDGLSKRDKAMIQMLSGGGGGMTINVYPSQGMNESELANMVSRQIAFQLRRGGA
jgi:gas vesicle protein